MHNPRPIRPRTRGFTLPAVMVVAAAMLILAVGLLAIIGIERKTSRSFADMKRAELAARAGLEDFRAVLRSETANDDFLVIGGPAKNRPEKEQEIPQHLYIARGEGGGDTLRYRYIPLYSTKQLPDGDNILAAPEVPEGRDSTGKVKEGFAAISGPPWLDKPTAEWIPVENEKGETVARYAYWVEDLQGRLDAKTAGNTDGAASANLRNEWPSTASGLNPEKPTDEKPKLNQVAIHVLDPKATEDGNGSLTRKILDGRHVMLSPESVVAAGGYGAPLKRLTSGLYEEPVAAALEKSASPVIQPYQERAVVPYAPGLSADVVGKPKLNLNELLGRNRSAAVGEFANWVNRALPRFADERKGGFPEDYLQTIAANVFDYADTDNDATVSLGSYRGLDGYPLSSEIILHIRYLGQTNNNGSRILNWRLRLYAELWNMSNVQVNGRAQVSYEVGLAPNGVGSGVGGKRFDDPGILRDPARSTHQLIEREGRFWSPELTVDLRPNEYRMYQFASVDYKLGAGLMSDIVGDKVTLSEPLGAAGLSLSWNGNVVERVSKIVRDSLGLEFKLASTSSAGKAAIPGHSYGPYGSFVNNMGDPRMSHYFRTVALGENSYPGNISPNRRNVRRATIYDGDGATKALHYGRVLPAEWPDGGHNSATGSWSISTDTNVEPTDPRYLTNLPSPVAAQAPLRLSNLGRFFSATELGRAYDPMMWKPTFGDLSGAPGSGGTDTAALNGASGANLPTRRPTWPEVEMNSPSSADNGGGNTLRIGRAEHPRFRNRIGLSAAHLLDLFHAGDSTSEDRDLREGELVTMAGNVNLNTADKDTLRALAAGILKQDPELGQTTSNNHQTSNLLAKPVSKLKIGAPTRTLIADRIADALIGSRPFASAAQIANAREEDDNDREEDDKPVFGNREMYSQNARLEWSDSAAEEVFARVYDASTTRSRNFRIWVIGQAIVPQEKDSDDEPEVLAESKKSFTVFADPGERTEDGEIDAASYRPRVTHENDF
jgi:type II secretory pathway pseudopilin PulG